jgi:hypothetical protein
LTSRARADKSIYPAARRQSLGAGVAQLVERVLAKHKVVGSKPITRSSKSPTKRWRPRGDLAETAKEILHYIADSGSVDATIVAPDEV